MTPRAAAPWFRIAHLVTFVLIGFSVWAGPARAAEEHDQVIRTESWSFSGPFGVYDKAQLQRGFRVYKEICAACHGAKYLYYRNLSEEGGPEFSEDAAKSVAASVEIEDGPDDQGEMFQRPGRLSDALISPYRNDQEARAANNGAYPPDLSLMAKARPHGVDYLYSLLTGYTEAPSDFTMTEGMYYNSAFPGHQIAMPPPLFDDMIEYTDGTAATVDNYAKDVTAFMMWAAEPKLELRNRVGFRVLVYLAVLAGLLYVAKRRVWRRIAH